jgi:hypothetical protein
MLKQTAAIVKITTSYPIKMVYITYNEEIQKVSLSFANRIEEDTKCREPNSENSQIPQAH